MHLRRASALLLAYRVVHFSQATCMYHGSLVRRRKRCAPFVTVA